MNSFRQAQEGAPRARHLTPARASIGTLALAAVLGGCATTPGSELLLLSNADGDHEIYLSDARGTVRRLTDNDRDDVQATWSPDGTRIAFVSMRDGNAEIYVIEADGGNERRLTDNPGIDAQPLWSPDGARIAFVSDRSRRDNVYVLDLASGKISPVSDTSPDARTSGALPVWSPDGQSLAFIERSGPDVRLIVARPDGRDARELVQERNGAITGTAWSPDGARVAYTTRRKGNVDVYVYDLAAGEETRLTEHPSIDADPVWSPDGQRLIWLSARDDATRRQIYMMNADGSAKRRVIGSGNEEMNASWSPDGRQISFVMWQDGSFRAYVTDVEQVAPRPVDESDSGGIQLQPRFRPRGTQAHTLDRTSATNANDKFARLTTTATRTRL